jgi:hypothetical protein
MKTSRCTRPRHHSTARCPSDGGQRGPLWQAAHQWEAGNEQCDRQAAPAVRIVEPLGTMPGGAQVNPPATMQ